MVTSVQQAVKSNVIVGSFDSEKTSVGPKKQAFVGADASTVLSSTASAESLFTGVSLKNVANPDVTVTLKGGKPLVIAKVGTNSAAAEKILATIGATGIVQTREATPVAIAAATIERKGNLVSITFEGSDLDFAKTSDDGKNVTLRFKGLDPVTLPLEDMEVQGQNIKVVDVEKLKAALSLANTNPEKAVKETLDEVISQLGGN